MEKDADQSTAWQLASISGYTEILFEPIKKFEDRIQTGEAIKERCLDGGEEPANVGLSQILEQKNEAG